MGKRIYELCVVLGDTYRGKSGSIWDDGSDAKTVYLRLRELPGYGDQKARILLAILAKRLNITPQGWQDAAAPYSDAQPRSVADVDSPAALAAVRAFKQAQKNS